MIADRDPPVPPATPVAGGSKKYRCQCGFNFLTRVGGPGFTSPLLHFSCFRIVSFALNCISIRLFLLLSLCSRLSLHMPSRVAPLLANSISTSGFSFSLCWNSKFPRSLRFIGLCLCVSPVIGPSIHKVYRVPTVYQISRRAFVQPYLFSNGSALPIYIYFHKH